MSKLPIIVVCPSWREDGPFGKFVEVKHLRMLISAPLSIDALVKLTRAIKKCPACGADLVMSADPEIEAWFHDLAI